MSQHSSDDVRILMTVSRHNLLIGNPRRFDEATASGILRRRRHFFFYIYREFLGFLGINYENMDTIRLRWGSKGSWGEYWISKYRITYDNTNRNTTLSEAQGVSLRITSGVRVNLIAMGLGLPVVDSYISNHCKDDFTPLETIRRFIGIFGSRSLLSSKGRPSSRSIGGLIEDLRHAFMDFKSFMMEGINGEFHFEPEGGIGDGEGSSPSTRSVNNEILVINVDPLNSVPPSKVVENIGDSDDASLDKDVADEVEKLRKVPPRANKVVGDASDPLNVDSDPNIHEFPSTKELKDFTDCH
ncbi:hypothetical protein Tco_0666990 [Tanacetum coccineum]